MTPGDDLPGEDAAREMPSGEVTGEATDSEESGTPRRQPQDLAKEAMERARASARQRGATRSSPTTARRRRNERRAETEPFSSGREPRAMSESVDALLRRMGWTEQIEVAAVTARWRDVIGDQIADHCEPVSFDEGVLLLSASSTAWATQMTLMSGQIRHRINEEFGRDIVKELKVVGPAAKSWVKGPRTVKGRGPRDTYG